MVIAALRAGRNDAWASVGQGFAGDWWNYPVLQRYRYRLGRCGMTVIIVVFNEPRRMHELRTFHQGAWARTRGRQ